MKKTSETPIDEIWSILSRWESQALATRLISDRCDSIGKSIEPEKLKDKAIALSYCLRTARENILLPPNSLTTSAIGNYYGCMWLWAAVAVSDPSNDADLPTLEKYSKAGHGLRSLKSAGSDFPHDEFLYVLKDGLYCQFLKWNGLKDEQLTAIVLPLNSNDRSPKSISDVISSKRQFLISLGGALARVPAIAEEYSYVSGRRSETLRVYNSPQNAQEDASDILSHVFADEAAMKKGFRRIREYSWIAIHDANLLSEQDIQSYGIPLEGLEKTWVQPGTLTWTGKFIHPLEQDWSKLLPVYKSPARAWFWMRPLLSNLSDPLAIHFIILYQLSIFARYRPAIWREILEGELNQYRFLIDCYNRVFQRVIPELVLRKILNENIQIITPGSLWG